VLPHRWSGLDLCAPDPRPRGHARPVRGLGRALRRSLDGALRRSVRCSLRGGDIVQVSASGVQFEQQAIAAPANTVFTIHFDNKDASTLHNVEIKDGSGMTMFKGALVNGPAQADYQVPALPAGAYTFNCTVHPNMTGTLTVGP
jgi:plastocyanin